MRFRTVMGTGLVAVSASVGARAAALAETLTMTGAKCFPYHYNLHAGDGVPAFVQRTGCTAWWTITDHQAIDHIIQLQQVGFRMPADIPIPVPRASTAAVGA